MVAQWAQQKKRPSASTPCPITLHPQCSHAGASVWMAHSKLSKVWESPSEVVTENALS
jgi:hypothetical protein